jgi:hypothetical protein
VSFDPAVEAIRSALRAVDANPRAVPAYLTLIDAYEKCADKEDEAELLEQAEYVIRDVRKLPMTEEERRQLAVLEARVASTLNRIRSAKEKP